MSGDNLTILVAIAAGLLSFLSPCVLPLVPAYVGQLTAVAVADATRSGSLADGAARRPSRWAAFRHALAYVAGFGPVPVSVVREVMDDAFLVGVVMKGTEPAKIRRFRRRFGPEIRER